MKVDGRDPVVTVPAWLLRSAGIAALGGLALAAAGVVPAPRWPAMSPAASTPALDTPAAAAAAEARMRAAARYVYEAKRQAGAFLDPGGAPERAALIGPELSPLVTTLGSLDAKRLAASPVWARALTLEFARAGVGPGGVVAASFSGSFPGLNLAVICAAHELGARVLAVSSVTASTWGATEAGFTWPEIEARLVGAGLIVPASIAVSVGGDDDRGLDLDPDARALAGLIADRTAETLGAARLHPTSIADAVAQRIAAFERRRGALPIVAFVNVGGTAASLGSDEAVLRQRAGWLRDDGRADAGNGLLGHFARRRVPVLHLLNLRTLGARWGVEP